MIFYFNLHEFRLDSIDNDNINKDMIVFNENFPKLNVLSTEKMLHDYTILFVKTAWMWNKSETLFEYFFTNEKFGKKGHNVFFHIFFNWFRVRAMIWGVFGRQSRMILDKLKLFDEKTKNNSSYEYQRMLHRTHYVNQILFSMFAEFILNNSQKEKYFDMYVNSMKQIMKSMDWFGEYGEILISVFNYQQVKTILNVKLDHKEENILRCLIKMKDIKISNLRCKLKTCCCLWCHKSFLDVYDIDTRLNGLKKCKKCRLAFYCSRKCQKLDWKFSHRTYCNTLAQRT